jgi:hypothetical protein
MGNEPTRWKLKVPSVDFSFSAGHQPLPLRVSHIQSEACRVPANLLEKKEIGLSSRSSILRPDDLIEFKWMETGNKENLN